MLRTVPFLVLFLASSTLLLAQQNQPPQINWVNGPGTGNLESQAQVQIPAGYRFADGDDTREIMEYFGNQATNIETGYLEPTNTGPRNHWYLVFEFEDIGYVEDNSEELDADAIMESLKEGSEAGNRWRRENGLPELHLKGWHTKPRYNEQTNNLEWATLNESNGEQVVNYNIRVLGREGVMSVTLVATPQQMQTAIGETRRILKNYSYKDGKKYSQWQDGDKIAEYGLAALITGGVVAAAAKSGLLGRFWKLILLGLGAIAVAFKKVFSSFFGKSKDMRKYSSTDSDQTTSTGTDSADSSADDDRS